MAEVNLNTPTPASSGDVYFDLWGILFQTRDIIYRARGNELRPHKLTVMDAAVLFFIDALGEKATPAEVSRWLFKRHHTIMGQLSRVEKKGLISQTKGILGENIISLKLTDKGKKALELANSRTSLHNIFSALSREEQKQLWHLLMKLRQATATETGVKDNHYFPKAPD